MHVRQEQSAPVDAPVAGATGAGAPVDAPVAGATGADAPVDAPVAGATGAGVLLSVLLPEQNPYCGPNAVLCAEKKMKTEKST